MKPMNGLALLAAGVGAHDRVVCSGAMRVGTGVSTATSAAATVRST